MPKITVSKGYSAEVKTCLLFLKEKKQKNFNKKTKEL
jgi:hypothetical protein